MTVPPPRSVGRKAVAEIDAQIEARRRERQDGANKHKARFALRRYRVGYAGRVQPLLDALETGDPILIEREFLELQQLAAALARAFENADEPEDDSGGAALAFEYLVDEWTELRATVEPIQLRELILRDIAPRRDDDVEIVFNTQRNAS